MAEASRNLVDARDLPGGWSRVTERLAEAQAGPPGSPCWTAPCWSGPRDGPAWAPEAVHAWRRLSVSGGRPAVPDLAAEVGWSPRRLGNAFRHHLGLTPMAVARVVRLQRVLRLLLDGVPQAPWGCPPRPRPPRGPSAVSATRVPPTTTARPTRGAAGTRPPNPSAGQTTR
ncbi:MULTISPECIES: helix-turn-helix domain-containing protein [Streptomyces]|uniref:Helix-turn-helix domain-containing protein n=2 Tax=Streptomyces TaxID=1883 RepID=A0ABV9IPE2_9ACTN